MIPFELVSLLAIFQHDAAEFWAVAQFLGFVSGGKPLNTDINLGTVIKACNELGLPVSAQEVDKLGQGFTLDTSEGVAEFQRRAGQVVGVIHSELKSRKFLYVESERQRYLDRTLRWIPAEIQNAFPSATREIAASGRCYALGETDASVFHSMRALEVCLKVLCDHFTISPQGQWENIINKLESSIRTIGPGKVQNQKKSAQDVEDEHFFAQIAAQIFFFKNGWRNYVMHLKENYSDRDARQTLDSVVYTFSVAAQRLGEEI